MSDGDGTCNNGQFECLIWPVMEITRNFVVENKWAMVWLTIEVIKNGEPAFGCMW